MRKNNLCNALVLCLFGLISLSCETGIKEDDSGFLFGSTAVYCVNKNTNYTTRTIGTVTGNDELSKYGGDIRSNYGATGFFRTHKEGRNWTLVDPDGYPYFSIALNSVKIGGGRNLPAELKAAGFNGVGNWSDEAVPQINTDTDKIPYTLRFSFMANYKNTSSYLQNLYNLGVLPVFNEAFAASCDTTATQLAPHKDDPWLLGYFSDNELPFYNSSPSLGDVLSRFLALPENDTNRAYTLSWLAARGKTENEINSTDEDDFAAFIVGTYYRTVSEAIKKYDSNHLYLGSRLHGGAKTSSSIFRAAGPWVDVFSVNYYDSWTPSTANMDMWLAEGKKPFFISEFYVKGEDTHMTNSEGAGWEVRTQSDRGLVYTHWILSLMSHPGAVGAHWFKYSDETGTSNKGMLNGSYVWYEPMREAALNTNRRIYTLTEKLRE